MSDAKDQGRRSFIRRAVVATGVTTAAAATYATGGTVKSSEEGAKPAAEKGKGYRETDHIREYYRLARF